MNKNRENRLARFSYRAIKLEEAALSFSSAKYPALEEFVFRPEVLNLAERFLSELNELYNTKHGIKKYEFGLLSKSPKTESKETIPAEHGGKSATGPSTQPPGSSPIHSAGKPGASPTVGSIASVPVEIKINFNVANAKSGEIYRARIEGKDTTGQPVSVLKAKLPDGLGLSFDTTTGELHGTPSLAGDHKIALQWRGVDGHARSGECLLIVNANPRDLWKDIEANPDDPYFKPNEDCARIDTPLFKIVAASKRGRSHAHSGTCRDDDFFVHHDPASAWNILIVADGAGSAKSSRKGAELAVKKAGELLVAELSGELGGQIISAIAAWDADNAGGSRALKEKLYKLFGASARAAVQSIDDEANNKGGAYKDYSTTLLVAVCRKDAAGHFVSSFWIGDGAVAAYGPRGQVRLMGVPDSGEFAGQTRFLDKAVVSDAEELWNRIEFARFTDLTSLILMTDGISDPRFETDNGLADSSRWDALWGEMAPALADSAPEMKLVEWLDFFTPGHHDDRTIALLW